MHPDSGEHRSPLPRSKVELLYHEMLHEFVQMQRANADMVAQLNEAATLLREMPTVLRQSGAEAGARAAMAAERGMHEATHTLAATERELRIVAQAIVGTTDRNAWRIGITCAGSALVGALLGAALGVGTLT